MRLVSLVLHYIGIGNLSRSYSHLSEILLEEQECPLLLDQPGASASDLLFKEQLPVIEDSISRKTKCDLGIANIVSKDSLDLALKSTLVQQSVVKKTDYKNIKKTGIEIMQKTDPSYKSYSVTKTDFEMGELQKDGHPVEHIKETEKKSTQHVDRGLSPIAVYTAYPGDIKREGSECFIKTYDAPTMQEPAFPYMRKPVKRSPCIDKTTSPFNEEEQPLEILLDHKVIDTAEGKATSESKLTLMNPTAAKTLDIFFKTESHIRITCNTQDISSVQSIPFQVDVGVGTEGDKEFQSSVCHTDQALSPISFHPLVEKEIQSPSITEEELSKDIGLHESFDISEEKFEEIFEKSEVATSPMSDRLLDTGVGTDSPVTTETASSPLHPETKSIAVSPHDSAADLSFRKEDSSTQTTLVDTVSARTSPMDLSLSFQEVFTSDQQFSIGIGFESQDETPGIEEMEDLQKEWSEADEKELGQTAQMTTSSMIEESRPSEVNTRPSELQGIPFTTETGTVHGMESSTIVLAAEVEGLGFSETQMRQLTPEEILSFAEKRDFFQRLSLTSTVPPPDFSSSTLAAAAKDVKGIEENELRKGEVVEEQVSFAERLKFFQTSTVEENGSRPSSKIEDETSLSADEEAERSITEKEFGEAKISQLDKEHPSSLDPPAEEKVIKTEIQLFLKSGVGGEAIEISKIKDYSDSRKDFLKEVIELPEFEKDTLPMALEDTVHIKQYDIHAQNQISEDWEVIQDEEIKAAQVVSITGNVVFVDKEKGTEETWEIFSKEKDHSMQEDIVPTEDKTAMKYSSQLNIESEKERSDDVIEELAEATSSFYFSKEKARKESAVEENITDSMASDKQWEIIESKKREKEDKIKNVSSESFVHLTKESHHKSQETALKETDWEMLAPEEITEIYHEQGSKKITKKTVLRTVVKRTFVQTTSEEQHRDEEAYMSQHIPLSQHSHFEHDDLLKEENVLLEKRSISSPTEKIMGSGLPSNLSVAESKQDILIKEFLDSEEAEKSLHLESFSSVGTLSTEALNAERENKDLFERLVSEESASNVIAFQEQSETTAVIDSEPSMSKILDNSKDMETDVTFLEINKNITDIATAEIAYEKLDVNYGTLMPESGKETSLDSEVPKPYSEHALAEEIVSKDSVTEEKSVELKELIEHYSTETEVSASSANTIATDNLVIQDLTEATKDILIEAAHYEKELHLGEGAESFGFATGGEVSSTITSTVVTEGGDINIAEDSRVIVRRISTVMTRDDSFSQTDFDSLMQSEIFGESQIMQPIDSSKATRDVRTEDLFVKETSFWDQTDITTLVENSFEKHKESYTPETSADIQYVGTIKQTIDIMESEENKTSTALTSEVVFDDTSQAFVESKEDRSNELMQEVTSDSKQETTVIAESSMTVSAVEQTEHMIQLEENAHIVVTNVEEEKTSMTICEKEMEDQDVSETKLPPLEFDNAASLPINEEAMVVLKKDQIYSSGQEEKINYISVEQICETCVDVKDVYGEASTETIPFSIDEKCDSMVQGSLDNGAFTEEFKQITKPVPSMKMIGSDIVDNDKTICVDVEQEATGKEDIGEEKETVSKIDVKIISNVSIENLHFVKEMVTNERDEPPEEKELHEIIGDKSLHKTSDHSMLAENIVNGINETTSTESENEKLHKGEHGLSAELEATEEQLIEKLTSEVELLASSCEVDTSETKMETEIFKTDIAFGDKEETEYSISEAKEQEVESTSSNSHMISAQEIYFHNIVQIEGDYSCQLGKDTNQDISLQQNEEISNATIAFESSQPLQLEKTVQLSDNLSEFLMTAEQNKEKSTEKERLVSVKNGLASEYALGLESKDEIMQDTSSLLKEFTAKETFATKHMLTETESLVGIVKEVKEGKTSNEIMEKSKKTEPAEQTGFIEMKHGIEVQASFSPSPLESLPEIEQVSVSPINIGELCSKIENVSAMAVEYASAIALPKSSVSDQTKSSGTQVVDDISVELNDGSESSVSPVSITEQISSIDSQQMEIKVNQIIVKSKLDNEIIKTRSDTFQKEESLVNGNLQMIDPVVLPVMDDITKFSIDDANISTDECYLKTMQFEEHEIDIEEMKFHSELSLENGDAGMSTLNGHQIKEFDEEVPDDIHYVISDGIKVEVKEVKVEEKLDQLPFPNDFRDKIVHAENEVAMPSNKEQIEKRDGLTSDKEIKEETLLKESKEKVDEYSGHFISIEVIESTKSVQFLSADGMKQDEKSLLNAEEEIFEQDTVDTVEKEQTESEAIKGLKPNECTGADAEIILSVPKESKAELSDVIDLVVDSSGQTSDYQSFSPEDAPRSNIISETAEAIFPPTFNTKESAYESVNKWMEKEMEIVREMLKDRPDSILSMEGYESVIAFEGDIQVGEEEPFKRSSPTAESFDDEARVEKCDTDLILQMLNNVSCSEIELAEVRTEDEAPDIEEDISPAAEELCNCTIQEFINDQTVSDTPVCSQRTQVDDSRIEQNGVQVEDHTKHSALESRIAFEVYPQSSLEVEVGSRISDDAFSVGTDKEHAVKDEKKKEVLAEEHCVEMNSKPTLDFDVSPSISLLKSEAIHDSTSDTVTSTTVLSAKVSDETSTNASPQLTLSGKGEERGAVSHEDPCESTVADTQHTKHEIIIAKKPDIESSENGDKPITETKDYYDHVSTTLQKSKCDEPSFIEIEESIDIQPTEINEKEIKTKTLSPEASIVFEHDVRTVDSETDVSSLPYEMPVDVTDKPDLEPELESTVKPVVTTPVSERKHKPESKPRRSQIPVYDVTGKYDGPEIKHIEPIIIEPEDDKDSLMIDRHHSTPDFRQLAGTDLEAILEEHAKDEQLRAVSESADIEDHFSPLHKGKPSAHLSSSPSDVPSPTSSPLLIEAFDSVVESEVFPIAEDESKLVTGLPTSVDVSASEISASCDSTEISVKIKENEMATESEDVFPIEETIYKTEASELHTIETTIEVSSTSTMSVTSQEQDTTAFPPNRIQMAFDNSAFVGVDMIDSTDNVDRDMARSPYEVVRRDIEDFKIGDDIKISVSEEEHVDTTELTKFNVLPTREEATKLAHEIIEEIKTEVAKRPPLKQVSSEISDEDLVEHEDSLDDTSLVNDMTDLKQPMLSETTAILDKELLFESPKEYKEFISEEETIISSREEHECHIKMEEKSCQNENNLEILAHTATSASDQDPLSITESTTALLLTNASPIQATYEQKMEKEIAIQPKGESDSAESETHFAITEAVPIASSPDESFGSSGSESKQHAVSDAIEADMHDSDSCLWDSTHRCSGQYVHGELVDEMAESVIKQIESLPTNATASSAVEDIDKPTYHSQINGPLEVDYIPEYDDEQYCSEEIKKDQHADLKPFSDDEGKVDSEKSANAQVEPTTSEIQLTETSQAAKQILPIVQITETRDSNTDFVEDYGFLPQQASLFDDQADQEIKKILSDESQTEDDRMTDIIERPLTPEPSEDMLTDENLLPESEQSSLKTNHSLETVQQITEKDEIIREEIIKCERVDSSSFMEEISDLDVTSSKMVESFAVKSSFQQDDLTQEEAMDIGSDKCDERDDIDEPEKLHAYEYGVHFASEPDYDEIPKYVESGYGDLYTHQEEDEDIFDEDIQESRNLVEGDKQIYPDLDNLLGPKFNTKSGEHDDSSVSSLQEFERFEAEIATGRKLSQGSVDSLNEHPPISKSGEHDDVSMNSLTEFERLERECAEAERIENVASEEAARLSEIEEGHESQASEASHETLSGPEDMDSIDSDDYEKRLSEIDEIIRQAQCNVEKFQEEPLPVCSKHAKQSKKISLKIVKDNKDIILDKSFHGVCEQVDANVLDSNLNRVAVPEQESKDLDSLEDDVTANMIGTCVGLPSTAADSHDVDLDSLHDDHSHSIEHDSLHETKQDHEQDSLRDDKTGDLDSLQEEMQILMQDSLYEERDLDQDSLHESIELPKDELDSKTSEILISDKRIDEAEFEDSLHEDLCTSKKDLEQEPYEVCAKVDYMISSTDSLEPSSSAATHATYQFDTDSIMSSSLNSVQASGEETLMASSTDSIDPERMSYIYANATITESPMHIESQYNYLLDSEGNVHQRSGQTDTDNIHTSFEAVQKLHSVDNVKKIVTISSDNNIYHEETKTMMPIEFQVKLGDSDSSVKSKLKSVEINGLQDTQSSISQDSIENGDIDQEGNIIKNDIQISQDTMFSNKLTKSIESLMEQQNEKFIVGEDSLRRKADHSGENVKIIPSTKPGEQIEEIRSTDEHGNIQIIRRIKRVVTVQRESVSSPESGKSDMSEPVEEVRTMDEKGNVKVIRRIRRIIRLSDSQSSDIDKQQLQGIFQNDDSQATSPDISQADSLQERFHYDSILKTSDIQTASQEVRSGRESVCSIRSDFSDTDSDIREFRTTDERGNVIIRRVRRIVTPLPPESNSRSSSPHSIEEKRMVDDKGNVIIRRVKRIIKVQQSDISENRDLTKIHSSVLSDEGGKSKEPKIVDEDDSVKQVVQTPDLSESIEATAIILKDCPQQSAEPPFDIPNGVTNSDDSMLPPKHTTFQSSDRAAIEEVRTVDEKGNVKIIRIRKRTIPYSSTEGQTDNDDVEQRLRDFLKSSSASESTNEEEVKEERSFDEKGNVVIVRTVKRHTASEPQVYSKTFTGSQAEQQSKEYVKTFDSLQSREDISEYQATDDEGNVVRVTQEVRVEPHIKTLSFTGPDVRQQMDEYLRLHKDSSQTFQSHPKYPTHSTSGSTSNGFTQSRTDTPSHVLTEDPYSPLETVLPFDTSSHQVESNGIQPVSGTALQFSKEQRRPQRSVQFEDFIHQVSIDNRELVQTYDSDDAVDSEEDEVIDYLKLRSSSQKDVEPTSDGKDSNLDGLQHCQSDPAEDARMADKNAEELTDHSELPI